MTRDVSSAGWVKVNAVLRSCGEICWSSRRGELREIYRLFGQLRK